MHSGATSILFTFAGINIEVAESLNDKITFVNNWVSNSFQAINQYLLHCKKYAYSNGNTEFYFQNNDCVETI